MSNRLIAGLLAATAALSAAGIIPQPNQMKKMDGSLELKPDATIVFADTDARQAAEVLAEYLRPATGFKLPVKAGTQGSVVLQTVKVSSLGAEGYTLTVDQKSAKISAQSSAGLFYGVQSLRQLLPIEIFSAKKTTGPWIIPCLEIHDSPRFVWRGMHLDVGRHFFAAKDIKKFIDLLAMHKLNTFHWHLSEDQGWRIEIKKYPKLTSIGGYRASTPPYGNRNGSDGQRYGGFYTQDQIREIVSYAAARHITIVPEIDMPGHMAAAIAAYPEFGNSDIPNYNPEVVTHWGVFPYILAPTEKTLQFVDDVLGEICDLFPSKYIHIGGDEAPKDQWKKSKAAQQVMQRENLQNEHELQSYFIQRVEKMLTKRGRLLVGWDEIREGGLSPQATVMSWRGVRGGIDSAKEGHDVVMAPNTYLYLDYYQNNSKDELAKGIEFECIGGYLPITKVYEFDPVLPGTLTPEEQKHVLGVQAQIWTEYIKTWPKAEYAAFPRGAALAEVAWTQPARKDFSDFAERLAPLRKAYTIMGVNAYDGELPLPPKAKKGSRVTTSMEAYGDHPAVCAFDGRSNTFFWSNRAPNPDDHLTISFDAQLPTAQRVTVTTGGEGKQAGDILVNGVLEISADGKEWQTLVDFKEGKATGTAAAGTESIRLRCTGEQNTWLIVKEITLE